MIIRISHYSKLCFFRVGLEAEGLEPVLKAQAGWDVFSNGGLVGISWVS